MGCRTGSWLAVVRASLLVRLMNMRVRIKYRSREHSGPLAIAVSSVGVDYRSQWFSITTFGYFEAD